MGTTASADGLSRARPEGPSKSEVADTRCRTGPSTRGAFACGCIVHRPQGEGPWPAVLFLAGCDLGSGRAPRRPRPAAMRRARPRRRGLRRRAHGAPGRGRQRRPAPRRRHPRRRARRLPRRPALARGRALVRAGSRRAAGALARGPARAAALRLARGRRGARDDAVRRRVAARGRSTSRDTSAPSGRCRSLDADGHRIALYARHRQMHKRGCS
jgi:hypothetical protein